MDETVFETTQQQEEQDSTIGGGPDDSGKHCWVTCARLMTKLYCRIWIDEEDQEKEKDSFVESAQEEAQG